MKPYQAIGWTLNQTTAITAITSTRIYHGNRPENTGLPCINYFESGIGIRQNGYETQDYTVNCRAQDPGEALDLAREVVDLFHGTSSTGIYGTQNGFDIMRAFLSGMPGVLPEPEDSIYNAPVTITMVYPSSTVS